MAVPGILLTLEGVEQVKDWGNEINFMGMKTSDEDNNIIKQVKDKLIEYKKEVQKTETEILHIFGVDSLEALQQLFKKTQYESGLIKLTGSNLRRTVLEQYEMQIKYNGADFYEWVQGTFLNRVIPDEATEAILEDKKTRQGICISASKKILQELANAPGVSKKGKGSIHIEGVQAGTRAEAGELFEYVDGACRVVLEKLSSNRFIALENLYKEETGKNPYGAKAKFNLQSVTPINNGSLGIKGKINYGAATSGGLKKTDGITKKERELLKNILVNEMANIIPEGNTARNIIKELLDKQDDKVIDNFFVGANTNDVIGILGEVSAAITLKQLIPNANFEEIIQWTAKRENQGKQISTDFIIKLTNDIHIGVQVKNTTKDIDKLKQVGDNFKIDFADANIRIVFNRLQSKYGIDLKKYFNTMKLIYISSSFNVPYKIKFDDNGNITYVDSNTQGAKIIENEKVGIEDYNKFINIRKEIIALNKKIDNILKALAPDLLFMSLDDNFKNSLANLDDKTLELIQGNNLYIIGGKPIFVSTILDTIIDDLSNLQIKITQNKINSKSKIEMIQKDIIGKNEVFEGGNIIDYLNKFSTEQGGVNWDNIRKASKYQSYQFTSSYLFS